MDWLMVVALVCQNLTEKEIKPKDCLGYYSECVKKRFELSESKGLNLDKKDLAILLLAAPAPKRIYDCTLANGK